MSALARAIADVLSSGRFDLNDEKACQAQIEDWLAARLPADALVREARLSPRDVPDFLAYGRVVIEVKMNGARGPEIVRQLRRYAEHDAVSDVIVATNKAFDCPDAVCGKPVYVVSLGRAWL